MARDLMVSGGGVAGRMNLLRCSAGANRAPDGAELPGPTVSARCAESSLELPATRRLQLLWRG